MPEPKAIVKFTVIAVVVYAVLTLLWPALDRTYAAWFRAVGNTCLARLWIWPDGSVRFFDAQADDLVKQVNAGLPAPLPNGFEPPKAIGERDTLLLLQNRKTPGKFGFFRTSSRIMGYAPTALLVALALATPVSLWRRLWVLLWGLLLVHAFILFRITVVVLKNGFAADKPYALIHPGPFWQDVLRRADEVLADNPTFSYLVPVVLWLLVLIGFQIWAGLGRKPVRAHKAG